MKMENQNTVISMEKCIPIPLDEKQPVEEEKSDKTSLVKSVKNRKISFNFDIFLPARTKSLFMMLLLLFVRNPPKG